MMIRMHAVIILSLEKYYVNLIGIGIIEGSLHLDEGTNEQFMSIS